MVSPVSISRMFCLFLGLNLMAAGAMAQDQGGLHQLNRQRFESTKTSPGDKDGSLGDAAAQSANYDVLRYSLDLRINPAEASLEGTVQMKFSALVPDFQDFVFDLDTQLGIDRVVYHGSELEFTQMDGDSVVVQLPAALSSGQVDSLVVEYSGNPREPHGDRGLMYRTNQDDAPCVASMSEPAYAKYWWPCKDRPDDKAFSSVSITVPDTLVAVSNGTLILEEPAEPGWKTYHWSEAYPMPTYLVSVAVSNYLLQAEQCDTPHGSSIPLRHWVFPLDYDDALVDFAPMCEMMEFCEGHFGSYPFQGEKYGHAEFLWSGAMEHTTVTSIGHRSIRGDGSRDWLIVHELGHQWFGDSLTPHTWADIWLNEGFATYTEALWQEHKGGREDYLAYLDFWRDDATWAFQGPVYDPVPVFPGRVIYDKGSWILHMLRERMGDTAFFSLVQDWANGGGRPGGTVTTEEFITLAESFSGQELDSFFWPYLETNYNPEIVLDYQVTDGDAGAETRLEISLRQVQDRLFNNIFPVVVTTTAGVENFSIHLIGRTASAIFELSAPVVSVVLDPEASVLWNPSSSSGQAVGMFLAYPNPSIDHYVYLRYHLEETSAVVVRIYDAKGREVAYRDLGQVQPDPGFNEYVWNEKDDSGALVAAGIYWATMEIKGFRSVLKITVLH